MRIVYLPNYDIDVAKIMIPGVDLWLNTPQPPHEASGTSGMKAALNGVPSLSILDGWWIEGCVENLTGWAINEKSRIAKGRQDRHLGPRMPRRCTTSCRTSSFPCSTTTAQQYLRIMLFALALNGSFFNTQRMLQEYLLKAYMSGFMNVVYEVTNRGYEYGSGRMGTVTVQELSYCVSGRNANHNSLHGS